MKYLLTYIYDGKRCKGDITGGQGSVVMTANTDKITPEVIQDAIEWVKKELLMKGITVKHIASMGWFRFDEEESENE
ncbi:MAG: hypothetical protein J6S67_16270 [Methanobrevibacter sp.]|nr:hypothetical protein [Methanobrevibacter sp.]